MNNRITGVLLSVLMAIFLASYSIYTGVRYFYSPYQTETAFSYTIADSYRTRAAAIRNESVIPESVDKNDHIGYNRDDGEVVVPKTVVAQVFFDPSQLLCRAQLKQLDSEIDILKTAQSVSGQILVADTISGQVNDVVGSIVSSVSSRDLRDIYSTRDRLQLLLGEHRISSGRDSDYSKRISYLEKQKRAVEEKLSDDYRDIVTGVGGYFCSVTDGYESLLTTDFASLSVSDYQRAISGSMKPQSVSAAGRVQIGHDWFLVIVVPERELSRFVKGTQVSLDFSIEGCRNVPASINEIITDENGESAVFLKTNYINNSLIRLRQTTLDIRFKSYTGLRISTDALRYDGLIEGVYVKNGNLITFKAIERIYTGDGFVLCKNAAQIGQSDDDEVQESSYEPLSQFDEVVIRGTELYDGKVI